MKWREALTIKVTKAQSGRLSMPPSTCVPGASLASLQPCPPPLQTPSLARESQKFADESVMGLKDLLGIGLGKRVGRKPKNGTDQTITLSALRFPGWEWHDMTTGCKIQLSHSYQPSEVRTFWFNSLWGRVSTGFFRKGFKLHKPMCVHVLLESQRQRACVPVSY